MYAMTDFLCPSSHDAMSPGYLHIVKNAGVRSQIFRNFEMSNKNKILCLMVDLIEIRKE
jgi:hypothetical protein